MTRIKISLLILILSWSIFSLPIYSQSIPSRFSSEQTLQNFLSGQPQFKSQKTDAILTLTFQRGNYISYLNGKQFQWFEVNLDSSHPTKALILMPCPGVGKAVFQLDLNSSNPILLLFPGESEGLVSYDMQGYMLNKMYGLTDGVKQWTDLTLDSKGFTFTPVKKEPKPKLFNFTGFNPKKYIWDPEQEKINSLPDLITVDNKTYKIDKKERTAVLTGIKGSSIRDDLKIPNEIKEKGFIFKVTSIGKRAFMNSTLNSVTIPETIKSIGDEAFLAADINKIYIESATTKIGNGAFSGVKGLSYIEYPQNYVPNDCFKGCPDLKYIRLTSSKLSEIGRDAFSNCPQLNKIWIDSSNPPVIAGAQTSKFKSPIRVYTPEGTQKAYKSASGWNAYKIKSQNGFALFLESLTSNKFRLGLEFIDFAIGQADKAGNKYLNLDLGLRLRYGDWEDPLQFGIGVRAGIGMINPYSDYDDDKEIEFNGKFFMPIDLQIKCNLFKAAKSTWCFADAKLICNVVKDKDFQRPMAWSVGLGFAGKHWEWNLYYKREFGKYSGKYVAFKEYIPFAFGTTLAYYFNLN